MKKINEIPANFLHDWCEKFHKEKKSHSMTNEQCHLMMILTTSEMDIENNEETKNEMRENFIIKVIEKRLKLYNYTMSFSAICALGFIFCDNLGENTMNMTYIEYLTKKFNVKHVNMEFLSMKVFPMGVIDESFYTKMWDEQKCEPEGFGMDNVLDYKQFINNI